MKIMNMHITAETITTRGMRKDPQRKTKIGMHTKISASRLIIWTDPSHPDSLNEYLQQIIMVLALHQHMDSEVRPPNRCRSWQKATFHFQCTACELWHDVTIHWHWKLSPPHHINRCWSSINSCALLFLESGYIHFPNRSFKKWNVHDRFRLGTSDQSRTHIWISPRLYFLKGQSHIHSFYIQFTSD